MAPRLRRRHDGAGAAGAAAAAEGHGGGGAGRRTTGGQARTGHMGSFLWKYMEIVSYLVGGLEPLITINTYEPWLVY